MLLGAFSFFSLIVFETSDLTSLSRQLNSFGYLKDYTAPKYLLGVFYSFQNLITVFGNAFSYSLVSFIFFKDY